MSEVNNQVEIFKIDVHKVMFFDSVQCNNGKDWGYIIDYKVVGETIIPLFIKTPKNIFSYGPSQCDMNSAYTMQFNLSVVA